MEYNTKSIISHIPAIAYEGEVTIKLYNDNKLVKTFANHNNGTNRLFSFILSCLKGSFEEAKDLRPTRLIVLKQGETTQEGLIDDLHSVPYGETGQAFWNEAHTLSPAILYNKVPAVGKETADNTTYYFINYNFRIPFSLLATDSVISKLALVSENYSKSFEDICAYFRLDDEPINTSEYGSSYTLIIDWKLKFKNISGGTN